MDRSRFDLHDGIAARNQSEIMRAAARQAGDQREPTMQRHLDSAPRAITAPAHRQAVESGCARHGYRGWRRR